MSALEVPFEKFYNIKLTKMPLLGEIKSPTRAKGSEMLLQEK